MHEAVYFSRQRRRRKVKVTVYTRIHKGREGERWRGRDNRVDQWMQRVAVMYLRKGEECECINNELYKSIDTFIKRRAGRQTDRQGKLNAWQGTSCK